MIFSFDKSTYLEGWSEKNPEMIWGDFSKMKGKNKEIIIAHPLDKFLNAPLMLLLVLGFQKNY